MDIVLATKNRKKVEELGRILSVTGLSLKIHSLDEFPECADIVEDGATFEENAVRKAAEIAAQTGMTAIADDSGLEVDALDGAPGIYSARYAGENANDVANNRKLLDALKNVPEGRRGARFACCIALASAGEIITFMGYVEGAIGFDERGHNGFGYDPLFFPEGRDVTFAQMDDKEKNTISHRARALGKLQEYLVNRP